jgi:hypothetical protein
LHPEKPRKQGGLQLVATRLAGGNNYFKYANPEPETAPIA